MSLTRASRIQRIRQQIAEGSYETEARLDAALDRLCDELAHEPRPKTKRPRVAPDHYQEVA